MAKEIFAFTVRHPVMLLVHVLPLTLRFNKEYDYE
jgi:hypothetical protein